MQADMTTPIATGFVLAVTSVAWASKVTEVPPSSSVTVHFNEPRERRTGTSRIMQLRKSAGSAGAASVRDGASTDPATLPPSVALANSSTYTVLVHGGSSGSVVMSAADIPLAANFSSSFTTAATALNPVAAYNFAQGSGSVLTD